jgi:broad specificity phosphatase PhoE
MTTLFLIRHGANDAIGRKLVGRLPGVSLNERGRGQARDLVDRLAPVELQAIYSSPLERCLETCAPLSEHLALPVLVREGLTELDFGSWSGATFERLEELRAWKQFNAYRTGSRPPGGETLLEAQERMVRVLEKISEEQGEANVAVFSHGDPLKAAVAHYLGAPLELIGRFVLAPASISVLSLQPWGAELRCLNDSGAGVVSGLSPH